MAEPTELELLNLIGGGGLADAGQAYDQFLHQTADIDNDPRIQQIERDVGAERPRGWQAFGNYLLGGIQRNARQIQAMPTQLNAIRYDLSGDIVEMAMAQERAEQIERQAPEALWRLQDVRSAEDFSYWLAERFGENALTLLASFTGGGAGLLAGRLGARALGGGDAIRRTAGTVGMLGGGFGVASALETAGTAQEQAEVTGSTQPHLSIPGGLLKGVLELWTPGKVLSALNMPGRQLGRTLLGGAVRMGAREAGTEALQESIDIALRMVSDPNYSFFGNGPLYMGEGAWRLLEATVAGGAIGGMLGAPATALERRIEARRDAQGLTDESGGLKPGQQQRVDPLRDVPMNILREQPEGRVEVYRGDSTGFARPDVNMASNVEPGLFFTTDLSEADKYARGMQQGSEIGYQQGSNIRREVLDTTNMKEISWRGDPQYQDAGLRREAQKAREEGFSGVWVTLPTRKEGSPRTQYVVWDQKAIVEPEDGLLHQASVRVQRPQGGTASSQEDPRVGQIVQAAVDHFGLTNDINTAGFILPDGRMLHLGPRGAQREHSEVYDILPDYMQGVHSLTMFLEATRAIRYDVISGGFEATGLPTDRQIAMVLRQHGQVHRGDTLSIDFTNPETGQIERSVMMENPTLEKIKAFFAGVRTESRTEQAPQTPLEQNQPGPVSTVRDKVLVGPRLDRDLIESTQPDPREDMWAVGPLLRSGIPNDLTDYYLDLVDADIPRYILRNRDGTLGSTLLTNTDLEYELATTREPSEMPSVIEVDQTTVVPAAVTATLTDLPDAGNRRVWFLPAVSSQEQIDLLLRYAQLQQKFTPEIRAQMLESAAQKQGILTWFRQDYDELLAAGLRVVPSRGTSFYYMGGAPVSGKEVEAPALSGRAAWWGFLTPTGEFLRQPSEGLSVVERESVAYRFRGIPVTIDANRFKVGEVSALPERRPDGALVYMVPIGLKATGDLRLIEQLFEDITPEYGQSWTAKNIENFRDLMRKGIYISPSQYPEANSLVTIKNVGRDQLIEGVDYDRIGRWQSSPGSVIVDVKYPVREWRVDIADRSETDPTVRALAKALDPLMPLTKRIMEGLGIKRALHIIVRKGQPHELNTAAFIDVNRGVIEFPVTKYSQWTTYTPEQMKNRAYVVLMHELGHLVGYEYFKKIPGERQQQLLYAYHKTLLARRAKVASSDLLLTPPSMGAEVQFDVNYYSAFTEWLAEQFRRFSTSDGVILSELDHTYAEGGDLLNGFIKETVLNDPVQARQLFEPDYFFSALMRYLRDYNVESERMMQLKRAQTLYSIDTDIAKSPFLTEVTSIVLRAFESMKHMMPDSDRFSVLLSPDLDPKLAIPEKGAYGRTIRHRLSNKVLLEIAVGSLPSEARISEEVFAHELIHAYRMLGLITESELNTLYRAALKEGKMLSQNLKNSIRQTISTMAKQRGWDAVDEESTYQAALREETVAYYVGNYAKTGQAIAEARGLLEFLIEFWNKVKAWLNKEGFQTRESVLRAFFSGEMIERNKRETAKVAATESYIRTWFNPDNIVFDQITMVDDKIEARIEKNQDEGFLETATYQFWDKATNFPVGQIRIETEVNGLGFNVIMQHSSLPGKSLEWINFIERDLGLRVLGPPIFTKSGLRAAGRMFPDVKKYYVAAEGMYYSPKYIMENLQRWESVWNGIRNSRQNIDQIQVATARDQVQYWRRLNAKIPKDIWTSNKHLLDQLFMLPRNYHKDGAQGALVREGYRADEAQMAQILGESQKPGATMDSLTLEATMRHDEERRTAAQQLGIPYEDAAAPQPEVMNIRRILAWADRRGATTDPRYEGYLKKVPLHVLASQEKDRIGFFSRVYWGLRQLIWRNEHIGGLQKYGQTVEQMYAVITGWHKEADEVAREWEAQMRDPKQREIFNRLLEWLAEMRYRSPNEVAANTIRHPTQQELIRQMRALGFTAQTQAFLPKIYQHPTQVLGGQPKDIFARFLDAVEAVSTANIARTHRANPVLAAQAIAELRKEMNNLRSKPYVPISRFGTHTITVRDADPTRNNRVLWFSAYDTHTARDAALRDVARLFPLDHVHKGRMSEEFFEFLGLPGPLIKEIKDNLPGITATQIGWLEQLEMQNQPDKSFRKRWVPRVGTPGYSMDFFRSFAHYFMHGSRYLARLQYRNDLYDAIASVEASIESLPNGSKRKMITDYMKAHLKYIMEGGKDWAKFKSAISLLQLGFSPAAAVMNLTQLPMVTRPWLSGVFGHSSSFGQLTKSMRAARNLKNGYITSGVGNYAVAREEMIRQGRIDIGQAAELGAYAEGSNLMGLLAGTKRQKMYRQFTSYGMMMFQKAEQVNREVTMHAVWELAQKQKSTNKRWQEIERHYFYEISELSRKLSTPTQQFTHDDAVAFIMAKEALDQTQGLYAPYARPTFMRKPLAGTLLIFYQFIQLMTYAFRYNPGMIQMWLMMAVVYGIAGIPGAEDANEIQKFINGLLHKVGIRLYGKDFDLIMQARRMVREITRGTIFDEVGPDLFVHGISRYSFGLPLLPDGYGIAPRFDASANGSMGKLIPGLYEGLHAINTAARPDQFFSDIAHRAAGAGFGWFFNLAQFFMESPGTVDGHKWEQALPRTMRAMAAALRYLPPELNPMQLQTYLGMSPSVGAATLPSGARIARFSATDPDDIAAIVTQLLGFRPTKVAEAQELRREQLEAGRVLQARRGALLVQWTAALQSGQAETQREVLAAIGRYNQDVATERRPELSISSAQIQQSSRGRIRTRVLQEHFIPPQRQLRPTYETLKDLFPGVRTEQVR